jgi:myo-inositol-1(or 4)-monophosphatase
MTLTRLQVAVEAAQQTGVYLLENFLLGNSQGELKKDRTLVTTSDREADKMIQKKILAHYPDDKILSEEKNTIFPETEHAWVIDPLDGTVNFSRGLHYWGVSIAHLKNGIPTNGVIFMPVIDELYSASLGQGAMLNGITLRTDQIPEGDLFPIFVHCSRMHEVFQVKSHYKRRSLGAAAYNFCLLARSTAVVMLETTPRIWDFAAGWLIIQEAGGTIKAISDQQPFPAVPGKDYAKAPFSILAATSEEIYQESIANINRW